MRPRRPSRIVAAALALIAVAMGWRAVSSSQGVSRAHAAGAGSSMVNAESLEALLAASDAAIERGELLTADAILRRAIVGWPREREAARRLVALHERSDFRQPVDDEAVREVVAALGPGYRVGETSHFVVVSNCDSGWTRRREALLERAYHEVMRFAEKIGASVYPAREKMVCVMIRDHAAYKSFGETHDRVHEHWVAGYYAGGSNRVVLYNDETNPALVEAGRKLDEFERQAEAAQRAARDAARRSDPRAEAMRAQAEQLTAYVETQRKTLGEATTIRSESKTVHEAAHLIAYNCGLQSRAHRYPLWITEGLATCFETDNPDRSFGPDRAFAPREEQFDEVRASGVLEGLTAFVGRMRPSSEADKADAEYAQAYALFRFVARFHADELAGLLADIRAEPSGDIDALRHVELFEARFGRADRFERRWLRLEDDSGRGRRGG